MCQESEQLENFRVLYQEAQNRRIHLSQVIVTNIGYAITLTAGIWGFFGKGYLDAMVSQQLQLAPWYLFVAASLTSIVLILWRWYTHYLDESILDVYPSIALYEAKLQIPYDLSTWNGVIKKAFKKENSLKENQVHILAMQLSPNQRKIAVQYLINDKCYGCRGHNTIDIIALIYILLIWGLPVLLFPELREVFVVGLVLFLFLLGLIMARYGQRDPLPDDIEKAIKATQMPCKNVNDPVKI